MDTLYKIADDIVAVADMLSDPDTPDEAVFDTLESLDHALGEKLDAIAALTERWGSQADRLDEEIKRLQARKRRSEARTRRLKAYALFHLQRLNKPTLETDYHNFTINKGRERVVVDGDLPLEYMKVEMSPKKADIKKALEAGVDLNAHIERGDPYLTIK